MRGIRLVSALAAAIACLALPGAGAALAASPKLRAGALTVKVNPAPFGLEFRDTGSGRVLRTLGPAGRGPADILAANGGPGYAFDLRVPLINNAFLGYYAAATVPTPWFHGVRLLEARRTPGGLELIAATDDPLGHRLQLMLRRRADGVVTMESGIEPGSGPLAGRASLAGTAFMAQPGERFLGFGERSNAVDQTGGSVPSWAEEGPFSSGVGEPLLRPLIPSFTFPTGPATTNFPVPWAISTRGFGVLVDQAERSTFELRSELRGAWRAETEAPRFRATIFAGPTPRRVLERYSDYAGRQPRPSDWIFGPWYQPTLEGRKYELADRFRDEDVPVTVAQTYTHYLPCGAHVGSRDGQREQVREYHRRGYRITTYVNPHICTDYQPVYGRAAERGFFVRKANGAPYVLTNPFTADQTVSEIDFTNPAAERYWQDLLREPIADGYDGWMEDFGEYTPTDAVFSDGRSGLQMHNRYPVLYHRASYRLTKEEMDRPAVFVRSGFHGVQPFARIVWGGDPTEDWSCSDGLCAAVHQALSMGLTGVAYWGSDIGGFHAIANGRTSDELNTRWLQFGAVSGVMRTQANGLSLARPRSDRSQVWSPEVLPVWRRYAKLRTQLQPYLLAASEEYQRTGMPLMRQLSLEFPGDERAVRSQTEFMFGPDLLAAPVIEPDARSRRFYLPRGRWIDLWRSARYREGAGTIALRRAETVRGGREVRLPAPLDELPLLVRPGAVIPMLDPDVDTLADVGRGRELVAAADRASRLRLLAFPAGRSDTRLAGGERLASTLTRKAWRLRLDTHARRSYRVEAALGAGAPTGALCSVRFDGRRLPPGRWAYDGGARVLIARFRGRAGDLDANWACG
jgi:alpha-glucosidase (family GH31 glycosyl hydrolase)